MRAVLDANAFISALLSRFGAPARVVRAWQEGAFELIVSAQLLEELGRALAYPKLRRHVSSDDADRFLAWLERAARVAEDPEGEPPIRSRDSGDDYLIALAAAEQAMLISGDDDLLSLASDLPVVSPADFLAQLEEPG